MAQGLRLLAVMLLPVQAAHGQGPGIEFFESKVRPVLVEHCYSCHSAKAAKIKGGLRLDVKAGWEAGGNSGSPAIVPGKPDESPLILAVQHVRKEDAMPPNKPRLPDRIVADLVAWVRMGAPDPRVQIEGPAIRGDWEKVYRERLQWWSLEPLAQRPAPTNLKRGDWPRHDLDRFILAALEARGMSPAPEADRRTLARRLSFALTGLPPEPKFVERFALDTSPDAYERLTQSLLDSPHFGEHWARHWLDVVHYADTHGYEWDVPAKHAWRYRDYLIRAFNSDVPFRRLIEEQIAGDLLPPRMDPATGINEALIGPMALRLGERRHGDSSQVEGVSQETVSNVIDTVSKAFLGTTVACAQCHDHKLDAVSQKDYYALAGVFMSTRWNARSIDAVDPNLPILESLRLKKQHLRQALARRWLGSLDGLAAKLRQLPENSKFTSGFPATLKELLTRPAKSLPTAEEFSREHERRLAENKVRLKLAADFTRADGESGWRWEGLGMARGLVRDGDFAVADEGDAALMQILPAGRWSHAWSQRLAGAIRSPMLDPYDGKSLSLEFAGGRQVGQAFNIDQAFHSERMKFLNQPVVGWLTLRAGSFDTLEGSVDKANRRVYLELATKSLNNYYPPRTGYGGVKESDVVDPRSWFGVTKVYQHAPGTPPLASLGHLLPAVQGEGDLANRTVRALKAAIERWRRDASLSDDVSLLDEAMRLGWIANDLGDPEIKGLVEAYRTVENALQPDRTIGSASEWSEGRDERIGIRGSYTDFGASVPRGNIRFLGGPATRAQEGDSGRLELAHSIASPQNPLTARVFVNRVWQHLFGEGLVRTPDDFGRLGQKPSHPELLDHLALRFIEEGWSLKKLVRHLVASATWRQSSRSDPRMTALDPDNRLWHHLPMRRLEAEAVRDAMLFAAGRLDATRFGPPIDPYRTAEDTAKRLLRGPLDGRGRRSIYTKVTLMEPSRFLTLFNQPMPRVTVGRRDVTTVPDQALALLNDPFVIEMSRHWSTRVLQDGSKTAEERIAKMFAHALGRPAESDETARFAAFLKRAAKIRGVDGDLLSSATPWQDLAHALFNVKEFIYVR